MMYAAHIFAKFGCSLQGVRRRHNSRVDDGGTMGQGSSLPWQSASNLALLPQEYAYPPAPPPDPPLYPYNHNAEVLGPRAERVPKRLWTYWEVGADGTYPEIVAACFARMRQLNPTWSLSIISSSTAALHYGLSPPPTPMSGAPLGYQSKGDWYRLEALNKYGGVYLDATMLPFRSVEHWVNTTSSAVQGFAMAEGEVGPDEPITMSSFAIATPGPAPRGTPGSSDRYGAANSTFVNRWHSHLRDALTMGSLEWAMNLNRSDLVGSLCDERSYRDKSDESCYFVIGLAWRLTREELDPKVYPTTLRSSTAIGCPFHYLVDADMNSKRAVKTVLNAKAWKYTDMVKLRAEERNCVGELDDYYDEPCIPKAVPTPCTASLGTPTNVAAMLRLSLEAEPDLLHSVSLTNATKEGECLAPSMPAELAIACIAAVVAVPFIICAFLFLEKGRNRQCMTPRPKSAEQTNQAAAAATEATTLLKGEGGA